IAADRLPLFWKGGGEDNVVEERISSTCRKHGFGNLQNTARAPTAHVDHRFAEFWIIQCQHPSTDDIVDVNEIPPLESGAVDFDWLTTQGGADEHAHYTLVGSPQALHRTIYIEHS